MKKENLLFLKQSKNRALLIVLLFIQIIAFLYYGNLKSGYYIDELYSLGYASAITREGVGNRYITNSDKWIEDDWMQVGQLKEQLIVHKADGGWYYSLKNYLGNVIYKKNYYVFLNIAYLFKHSNDIDKWPGLILNFIFLILTELSILKLLKKMRIKESICYVAIFCYGLCSYMIGLVVYIRFYILSLMLLWLSLLLLYLAYSKEREYKAAIAQILAMILLYFAMKNSELILIMGGGVFGFFILYMLIKKRWLQLCIGIVAGFIIVLARLDIVDILLYPQNYVLKSNSAAGWTTRNVMSSNVSEIKSNLEWLISKYYNIIYRETKVAVIICSVFALVYSYMIINDAAQKNKKIKIGLITFALLSYDVCVFAEKARFTMFIFLVLLMAVIICMSINESKTIKIISVDNWFIFSMFISGVVYSIFCSLAGLMANRYYSFGFAVIFVSLFCIFGKLIEYVDIKKQKIIICIITIWAFVICIMPFISNNIEYIYEDDEYLRKKVIELNDIDCIIAPVEQSEYNPSETVYDCISMLNNNSRVYALGSNLQNVISEENLAIFLLWEDINNSDDSTLDFIKSSGYATQLIGESHVSRAYFCNKK